MGEKVSYMTIEGSISKVNALAEPERTGQVYKMGEKMSKPRMWAIITIVLVALVVALGIGLGIALQNKVDNEKDANKNMEECICESVPADPSSSRLTKESPLYVKPTDRKESFYRYGTVVADAAICATYGMDMILSGGTTVDAAIAAVLCNGVYHSKGSGIGGGFFMTYYNRTEKKSYAIMAREMAPGAATENMYIPESVSSRLGGMAIGIPGVVKGLYEAWKLGGRLPWEVLFKPSIKMCLDGFMVDESLDFDKHNKDDVENNPNLKDMLTNPSTGEYFVKGEKMRIPKLGETLRRISKDPHTFYNGTLAADIILDIEEAGGIITMDDLDKYFAAVKEPVSIPLTSGDDTYTVYSPPPPSSGAVLLLILNILEGYGMTEDDLSTNEKGVETFHRIVEAFKHGFSVRSELGDMDQEDQDFKDRINELLTNMTSLEWGEMKRAKILHDTQPTDYYEPAFNLTIPDAGTAHISVFGPDGDAVSITSTINTFYGSMIVGSRTGIVFNNEMDDFSTPGTVNYFQVPASPANFIKPYKRPLSSMSPTIVVDVDGDVKLVTGSSGGTRIITSNALSIIHTLWLKLGLKEAIDYPKIHHQLLPTELRIEDAMPQAIKDGLLARGHKFLKKEEDIGSSIQAVLTKNKQEKTVQNMMDKKFTEIFAYADPTKTGAADGV